jgi:SlyX protein
MSANVHVANDSERDALEQRVVELETRLAFQEHAQNELSDALAELRAEAARSADLLRRVLEELKLHRGDLMADPADEPPPPHY